MCVCVFLLLLLILAGKNYWKWNIESFYNWNHFFQRVWKWKHNPLPHSKKPYFPWNWQIFDHFAYHNYGNDFPKARVCFLVPRINTHTHSHTNLHINSYQSGENALCDGEKQQTLISHTGKSSFSLRFRSHNHLTHRNAHSHSLSFSLSLPFRTLPNVRVHAHPCSTPEDTPPSLPSPVANHHPAN